MTHLWEFQGEDFVYARLAEEEAAAETMPPGSERDFALNRAESLRLVAADHCIYVDRDGKNHCACITCPAACGTPCRTILRLARIWRTHKDYRPAWNQGIDSTDNRSFFADSDWKVARMGGFKNVYLANRQEASDG